jgi:CelD/BcsL family acetyltransferase involved in cellulose biosynthesis
MIHFKIFEELNKDLLEYLGNAKKNSLQEVFQMPEWIESIINSYRNLEKLKIVFIYDNDQIILIAPLCINNIYGCKELRWISSDIIDYNSPIISKSFNFEDINFKNLWKKIIEELSCQCDLIFFNKIPQFVQYNNNPLINSEYSYYQKSYQLNLNNFNYDSFYNKKNNNKSKQTDRRKEKKLYEKKDIKYFHTDINEKNFYLLEELIFQKMTLYKSKKEKTFDNKNLINQYKKIINNISNDFKFNISVLEKEGIKISSIFGVVFNRIYYYLIPITHNTEFKKFSPGRFHISNLIKWAQKNDIKTIDFTAGDEEYKSNWSNFSFNMFYYIKLKNLKGIPRFIFLILYFKLRKNLFLKKCYQLIKYAI